MGSRKPLGAIYKLPNTFFVPSLPRIIIRYNKIIGIPFLGLCYVILSNIFINVSLKFSLRPLDVSNFLLCHFEILKIQGF